MSVDSVNEKLRLTKDVRENSRHYIPLSDADESEMLATLKLGSLADLYSHIPSQFKFETPPALPEERDQTLLQAEMSALASKNVTGISLLGDGLPDYEIHPVVSEILKIRELATAYTPYQPERSQGTLITQWIYQCGMAALTGFEAVNASLYDRSTALFEALLTSFRVKRNKKVVLVSEGIYPGDREVLDTHFSSTDFECCWIPIHEGTGLIDYEVLESKIGDSLSDIAAVAFPQVNHFGCIEDFNRLTKICEKHGLISIAVVDPLQLVKGGLLPPSQWGEYGTDIVVGEAQHLAFNPCFGGPGLGVFGVRTDDRRKNFVRSTPGRYVGKAKDQSGRDCFVAVMSAREQHIRKDKATSNICSNQAFIATLAGGAILAYGEDGLKAKLQKAVDQSKTGKELFLSFDAFSLLYPENLSLNEMSFIYDGDLEELIRKALENEIHLGVDISDRVTTGKSVIKVSFHDRDVDFSKIEAFLLKHCERRKDVDISVDVGGVDGLPAEIVRAERVGFNHYDTDQLVAYYRELGALNVSPDNAIYPLGSCTMKYNPQVNEWAAGLEGFQYLHPQANLSAAQGCLEVLYETQEWFQKITGLPGVTTQPVAGAQGELVGIKLFQAYHESKGEEHRDIVFIPATSHGTNFATAVVAGYSAGRNGKRDAGVVVLKTDPLGGIDLEDFEAKLDVYGDRLVGIMITNPNTCGVFELNFKGIADKVHEAGGMVYMDGANMNAIAGWVDLNSLGVDAVHNNIHKTWSIPHGGGGPGDGFVAVSDALVDFLPGYQVGKGEDGEFFVFKPKKSIGSFHRHWGNFNHKIRCLTYLKALGVEGVPRMSSVAVLAARYLFQKLLSHYDELPLGSVETPRMHEFVLSFKNEFWQLAEGAGVAKTAVMPGLGKLFLDFGYHAPTVAFPEPYGVMIEPTESYSKPELDRFVEVATVILDLIRSKPEILKEAPYFTPIDRVDEVVANRNPTLSERLKDLPEIHSNRVNPLELLDKKPEEILEMIFPK